MFFQGKNTRILGFNWVSNTEILFVTDHGIEFYQVCTNFHFNTWKLMSKVTWIKIAY